MVCWSRLETCPSDKVLFGWAEVNREQGPIPVDEPVVGPIPLPWRVRFRSGACVIWCVQCGTGCSSFDFYRHRAMDWEIDDFAVCAWARACVTCGRRLQDGGVIVPSWLAAVYGGQSCLIVAGSVCGNIGNDGICDDGYLSAFL